MRATGIKKTRLQRYWMVLSLEFLLVSIYDTDAVLPLLHHKWMIWVIFVLNVVGAKCQNLQNTVFFFPSNTDMKKISLVLCVYKYMFAWSVFLFWFMIIVHYEIPEPPIFNYSSKTVRGKSRQPGKEVPSSFYSVSNNEFLPWVSLFS